LDDASSLIECRWEGYLEDVRGFLRMPSVSPTGEGIEETADFLREFLGDRLGIEAKLLRYDGHPIVYGRMEGDSDRTLIQLGTGSSLAGRSTPRRPSWRPFSVSRP